MVLLDARDAVLLVRYEEDGRSYWAVPGGELEAQEDHVSAAVRELREETGLFVPIGPELAVRRIRLRVRGAPVDQVERYFLARVRSAAPSVADSSSEGIVEHRWWTLDALRAATVTIYPEGLADLLRASPPRAPPDPLSFS